MEEIGQAIMSCDVFVFMATKNSYSSTEARRQLAIADERDKRIVHYRMDNANHLDHQEFAIRLIGRQFVQTSAEGLELKSLARTIISAWASNGKEERLTEMLSRTDSLSGV